jgi:hypothetical protein
MVFRSESNAGLFGYTFDSTGNNLPSHPAIVRVEKAVSLTDQVTLDGWC